MSAVSLDDAKAFLNLTDTRNDVEVQATLDRAEAVLAARVGPLQPTEVIEVHTGPGPLLLRSWPVVSVTSATSGGAAVTDLVVEDTGVLYGRFTSLPRGVQVTYVAGRAVLPLDLEAAVLELLKHLWLSQRGNTSGPLNATLDGDERPRDGFLLPYRVQSLIEPHLLPALA